MAQPQSRYVCQQCDAQHRQWMGQCTTCGAWNAVVEEAVPTATPGSGLKKAKKGRTIELEGLKGSTSPPQRFLTGIKELDRVLGGGLVPASTILVAGDPGIGKSTLLLQASARLTEGTTLYISGEEATAQLRMRAQRTGLADQPVRLASATSINDILTTLEAIPVAEKPRLLIIDSIQTMYVDGLESAPGTVSQVRAAAQGLIALAKRTGIAIIMVGHVTKEGQIAGPRVLEHMVDTVLYFEGERGHQFRILRAVKNRFGPTDEIGVFEMTDAGLSEVANPSAMFMGRNPGDEGTEGSQGGPVPGAAVFAGIEGTRPVLIEIQALVAPSSLSSPRRAVVGWDSARLAMVIAVLEARCGMVLSGHDVYLSVAGGLRVSEPAADLAVAAALISSLTDSPAPNATLFFGEVGLSGEVRPVNGREARLKEAAKLGFKNAVLPFNPPSGTGRKSGKPGKPISGIKTIELRVLSELLPLFANAPGTPGQGRVTQMKPRQKMAGD
ncbi:MAG: DNA repair protein RadA [Alphaproteobacteria bacterium]|jgi:DNA repair protein RadA/Sms